MQAPGHPNTAQAAPAGAAVEACAAGGRTGSQPGCQGAGPEGTLHVGSMSPLPAAPKGSSGGGAGAGAVLAALLGARMETPCTAPVGAQQQEEAGLK